MKQILIDNALEAWRLAIKYCDMIYMGKATLAYRKLFVTNLHNAVELLIKQHMLNENDRRVVWIKNKRAIDEQLKKDFENSLNLNDYFDSLQNEKMKNFSSIEFNKLRDIGKEYFKDCFENSSTDENIYCDGTKLLGELRNNETHFFINKTLFLNDAEYQLLYNFMTIFYKILKCNYLLPYWGSANKMTGDYMLCFERDKIQSFSYKKVLESSDFVKDIMKNIEKKIFSEDHGNDAYAIASSIASIYEQYNGEIFEELWIYIEMLLNHNFLRYEDISEEIKVVNDEGEIYLQRKSYRLYTISF